MTHKIYKSIVSAVKKGKLVEPFSSSDFKLACPGFGNGTYGTFLAKHAEGNPSRTSELFRRVSRGKYVCIHPLKYDIE